MFDFTCPDNPAGSPVLILSFRLIFPRARKAHFYFRPASDSFPLFLLLRYLSFTTSNPETRPPHLLFSPSSSSETTTHLIFLLLLPQNPREKNGRQQKQVRFLSRLLAGERRRWLVGEGDACQIWQVEPRPRRRRSRGGASPSPGAGEAGPPQRPFAL